MPPRILIIGLGSIGSRHARLIREHFSYEVVALRSHRGQQRVVSGIPELSSWQEVDRQRFDVALITNPTNMHVDTAIKCAERGMHLFIEKPVDCRVGRLDELESLVDERRLSAYIAYPLRFHPVVRRTMERLDGRAVRHASMVCSSFLPDWRPQQDYRKMYSCFRDQGGGVLLDMSHELDMAEYLFGPIREINGRLSRLSGLTVDSDDCADLIAVHDRSVTNIHLNYFGVRPRRYMEIDTESGFLRADLCNPEILDTRHGETDSESFTVDADLMYLDQLGYFFGNLGRTDMDNSLKRAASLFKTMITFREEQGYGSTDNYLRAGRLTGGQEEEHPAPPG